MPKDLDVCACDESNWYRALLERVTDLPARVRGRTRLPATLKADIEAALAIRERRDRGVESAKRYILGEPEPHDCALHPKDCSRHHPP